MLPHQLCEIAVCPSTLPAVAIVVAISKKDKNAAVDIVVAISNCAAGHNTADDCPLDRFLREVVQFAENFVHHLSKPLDGRKGARRERCIFFEKFTEELPLFRREEISFHREFGGVNVCPSPFKEWGIYRVTVVVPITIQDYKGYKYPSP